LLGWLKHLAVAIILAVRGPFLPISVINSTKLGVNLKGTGRLETSSPKMYIKLILLNLKILIIDYNYLFCRQHQT